jgi:hypothetical protein
MQWTPAALAESPFVHNSVEYTNDAVTDANNGDTATDRVKAIGSDNDTDTVTCSKGVAMESVYATDGSVDARVQWTGAHGIHVSDATVICFLLTFFFYGGCFSIETHVDIAHTYATHLHQDRNTRRYCSHVRHALTRLQIQTLAIAYDIVLSVKPVVVIEKHH